MNITFMVVTVFLFFFGLIFLGKLIISGYVTYLLSVKFGDEYITSQMKRDTYIFGIVADLAAIGIVSSAESFYIILALIAVSLIASCIMYYFFVFRKSELSKPKKFYSVFILTITTAPYYFLISFASFGNL